MSSVSVYHYHHKDEPINQCYSLGNSFIQSFNFSVLGSSELKFAADKTEKVQVDARNKAFARPRCVGRKKTL